MTTTTAPCNRQQKAGFSLVETAVALSLAAIIFTALFSSWGFIARSSVGLANYTEMNSIGRHGLEAFAQDVRMAHNIEGFSSTGLTLVVDEMDESTRIYYEYNADTKEVVRRSGADERVVFADVEAIAFSRFTILRAPANNDLETKLIQLELRMVRPVRRLDATQRIVSARYIMRNKQVAT